MNNFLIPFLLVVGLSGVLIGQTTASSPSFGGPGYFSLEVSETRSTASLLTEIRRQADLTETHRENAADGRTYVRYQQQRAGAPVLGGEITIQLEAARPGRVSGHLASPTDFAPATAAPGSLPNAPSTQRPDDELETAARAALLPDYPFANQWNVTDHGDAWTTTNPWSASPGRYHRCRVLEVREPGGSAAEMIYLDLVTAKVIFRHQLHCNLQRRLHHFNTATSNIVWNEGDVFPGQLDDEDAEMMTSTEEIYSLYFRTFGRNSYNGNGGQMRGVTRAAITGCPNARAFNNIIMTCDGVVSDDIVGHEWTHNYTTSINGLIFRYQSGAIQEGLADIFGETLDLLNDRGLDHLDQERRDGCFTGNYRWSIAEDAVALDTILRDLWSPECKTDPASVNSANYVCPTSNSTDIHSNSLVVSRTFALLTDGDTTNTDTVAGIGLTKALHIFYHANANYVTRVTDFEALSMMLRQAARDLQGINLRALTLVNTVAPFSDEFITDADLVSLDRAIAATGLDVPAPCVITPTLAPNPPSGCEDNSVNNLAVLFYEDWEGDTSAWTFTENPVNPNTWDPKPWGTRTALPGGRAGRAIFAPNVHAGNCETDRDNGTADLTGPEILLPVEESDFRLRFDHYYSIEEGTDGGQLSISINGEDFVLVPEMAFLYNGYDGQLDPASLNDNPLAGTPAFTGADALSTSGSWGTSLVDLDAAGVLPGDRIRLRWTMSHDGCDGWLGWFIDDLTVGYCGAAILPVTYLRLGAEGKKDRVEVEWETAREENNAGFYVERRAANGMFQTLGFVPAGGPSYHFTDRDVVPGRGYDYRLRQVDLDGTEDYSAVVAATVSGEGLQVFPNPNRGSFTVSGSGATVSVYDLAGRLVLAVPLRNGQGNVAGLRRGVYVVRAGKDVQRVVVR